MRKLNSGVAITAAVLLISLAGVSGQVSGQPTTAPDTSPATEDNAVLVTIFLKHDQSRPLSELNAQLAKQGFYKDFPPSGVEVVSWYVAMGVGQIITLRLPASRLRELNRIIENTAWGSYRTEFYPTYDYKTIGLGLHEKPL